MIFFSGDVEKENLPGVRCRTVKCKYTPYTWPTVEGREFKNVENVLLLIQVERCDRESEIFCPCRGTRNIFEHRT